MTADVAENYSVETQAGKKMNGVRTFSGIGFSYHGQAVHRSTHQLHVIQADLPVVTWQHVILAYNNKIKTDADQRAWGLPKASLYSPST